MPRSFQTRTGRQAAPAGNSMITLCCLFPSINRTHPLLPLVSSAPWAPSARPVALGPAPKPAARSGGGLWLGGLERTGAGRALPLVALLVAGLSRWPPDRGRTPALPPVQSSAWTDPRPALVAVLWAGQFVRAFPGGARGGQSPPSPNATVKPAQTRRYRCVRPPSSSAPATPAWP